MFIHLKLESKLHKSPFKGKVLGMPVLYCAPGLRCSNKGRYGCRKHSPRDGKLCPRRCPPYKNRNNKHKSKNRQAFVLNSLPKGGQHLPCLRVYKVEYLLRKLGGQCYLAVLLIVHNKRKLSEYLKVHMLAIHRC